MKTVKEPEDLTKEQLIRDLTNLRCLISELERSEENRRKHHEELIRTRAMFEGLFEFAPDAIVVVGRRGDILRVNKQAENLFGYSRDELLNRGHEILLPGRFRKIHEEHRQKYLSDPHVRPMSTGLNLYGRKKDGSEFSADIALGPFKIGNETMVMAVIRDISGRRRAEETLAASESRYRTLFNAIDEGFCIVEMIFDDNEKPVDYRFLETNPSFENQTGLIAVRGRRMRELLPKHEDHWFETYGNIALTGQPARFQNCAAQLHRWYDVYAFSVGRPEDRQVAILFTDITERKKIEDSLKLTRFSVDHASVSTFLIGDEARILYVNEQACRSLGYSQEELLSMTIPDLDPNVTISAWNDLWTQLKEGGSQRFESLHRRKDGTLIPVEISANYVSFGGREYNWAYSIDISERKRAENALTRSYNLIKAANDSMIKAQKALRKSEERLKRAQEIAHLGSWELDLRSNHLTWSDEVYRIFGLRPQEFKATYEAFLEAVHPDDRDAVDAAYSASLREGRDIYEIEHRVIRKFDSEVRIVHEKCEHIRDRSGQIIRSIGMVHDITERKRLEEKIRHIAHHDPLTGLPNRRLFNDIAAVELAQADRNRKKLAILFLDLDRFKEINDTLGHYTGDLLLMEVAYAIKNSIRKSDTVARIGGDEFNVILADIQNLESISVIARKLTDSFKKPFEVSDHELYITTSIGISVYPDDGEDIDTLLRYADIAMYHAKENGRNNYQFYNPAINKRSIERMRLEGYLRQAIERGELVVYYQPQIDIKSGKIFCAEALVRWNHPEKGFLEPKDFLSLAEETELIISIDQWVLNSVCRQIRTWLDAGLSPVCITVNLSARQFQNPGLVDSISYILNETGMSPDFLDLEITETIAMSNVERTASQLRELVDMGIHISVDDFGTGYSSLNYLKKLPISKLKIDQSFIQDIATDPDDRAIITAVTSMARSMDIRTAAEGVETEEQLSFLRKTGCDEAQGYLFSRPVPVEKFRDMMMAGR